MYNNSMTPECLLNQPNMFSMVIESDNKILMISPSIYLTIFLYHYDLRNFKNISMCIYISMQEIETMKENIYP